MSYSNADFIARIQRHKEKEEYSAQKEARNMLSKEYDYANKERKLEIRELIYNKKLTKWFR